jgi:hypothetical protein
MRCECGTDLSRALKIELCVYFGQLSITCPVCCKVLPIRITDRGELVCISEEIDATGICKSK